MPSATMKKKCKTPCDDFVYTRRITVVAYYNDTCVILNFDPCVTYLGNLRSKYGGTCLEFAGFSGVYVDAGRGQEF